MRKSNIKVNNKDYRVNGYRAETENVIPTEISDIAPETPTIDGTYTLKAVVLNGTPTYQWVLENV